MYYNIYGILYSNDFVEYGFYFIEGSGMSGMKYTDTHGSFTHNSIFRPEALSDYHMCLTLLTMECK